MYTAEKIANDINRLNIKSFDDVMIHISFKSLGQLENGFDTLKEALDTALPDGTILLPALSWANVNADNPYFDVNKTPVCVGAFPEYYRRQPGVVRSLHPTHSIIAKGKRAAEYTKDHIKDTTPVGENSPLYKLGHADNAKILMIGCSLLPNTSMHGVEELVRPPYLFCKEPVEYTVFDGEHKYKAMHTVHNFHGYSQRYDRIADFLGENELIKGKIGDAESYVINAGAMWSKCAYVIKTQPMYYVDKN